MKAIKIDVVKRKVYYIDIEASEEGLTGALECEYSCPVYTRPNRDMIFVDDEGINAGKVLGAFRTPEYNKPLAGHGIVVGISESGSFRTSCNSTLSSIKKLVTFEDKSVLKDYPEPEVIEMEAEELREYLRGNKKVLIKKLHKIK